MPNNDKNLVVDRDTKEVRTVIEDNGTKQTLKDDNGVTESVDKSSSASFICS